MVESCTYTAGYPPIFDFVVEMINRDNNININYISSDFIKGDRYEYVKSITGKLLYKVTFVFDIVCFYGGLRWNCKLRTACAE